MKYVIDVPDNRVRNGILFFDAIGTPATPYDESEAEQRGAEQAWELARHTLNEMDNKEKKQCFGTMYVIGDLSYVEAREKYEEWAKQKDEIQVGDEIKNGGVYGVVTAVVKNSDDTLWYNALDHDGHVWCLTDSVTNKTGRHFPEVADLLKKMRETE